MRKKHGKEYRIYFPKTKTKWKIGPILTERVHDDRITGEDNLYEASGVCIATQTEGPSIGSEAILRIRMQIPPKHGSTDDSDDEIDCSKYKTTEISWMADKEIDNLKSLTEKGSNCTPKLIEYRILKQAEDQPVPGGYIAFILMEKLPGRNLENFHTFPLEKRDEVRIAAARALREFFSLGYQHMDPGRRNMIWDEESQRCFIVDMEDVDYAGESEIFIPRIDYGLWQLTRKSPINDPAKPMDPMIPNNFEEAPDDAAVRALASRSKKRKRRKKHY